MRKFHLDKAMIFLGIAILIGSYLISAAINRIADYGQALTHNTAQISSQLSSMADIVNGLTHFRAFGEQSGAPSPAATQTVMLTKEEALKYLNLTEKELTALIDQTDIPYIKLNRSYLFPKNALEEWLKNAGNKKIRLTFS